MKTSFTSHSQKETKDFAKSLARQILLQGLLQGSDPCIYKHALVLGLEGELGAGKTTFVQGFAQGLGIKEKVLSPTFVIMKKFEIRNSKSEKNTKYKIQNTRYFYHIDCYRLHKPAELLALGFKEIVSNPHNIVVIEWADRVKKILPRNSLRIVFTSHGPTTRRLICSRNLA